MYMLLSIISWTGAAICTAVVVPRCICRWEYQHILSVSALFTQVGGSPLIRGRVSDPMRFRYGCDSECAWDFVQMSEKVRRRPWQWLDKRPGQKAWAVHGRLNGKLQTHRHWDRRGRRRAKSRACSSSSLASRGSLTKKFVMDGQTVNSTYCCDV
jgi:hypothetical protein